MLERRGRTSLIVTTTVVVCLALASSVFAAQSDRLDNVGFHSAVWDPLLRHQSLVRRGSNTSCLPGNYTRQFALKEIVNGTIALYVDFFEPSALEIAGLNASSNLISMPFGEGGVCFAYSPARVGGTISLSLDLILRALRNDVSTLHQISPSLTLGRLFPVFNAPDPLLDVVEELLIKTDGVQPLSLAQSLKAAVAAHPLAQRCISASECMAVVASSAGGVYVTTMLEASRYDLSCIAITEPAVVSPLPSIAPARQFPLRIPAVLMASAAYSCSHPEAGLHLKAIGLILQPVFKRVAELWDVAIYDNYRLSQSLRTGFIGTCGPSNVIQAVGSSAIRELFASWNLDYVRSEAQYWLSTGSFSDSVAFIDYTGSGSGDGIAELKSRRDRILFMAASDVPFCEEEHQRFPDIQQIPVTAFAVAVVHNLPSTRQLLLTSCTLVSIFSDGADAVTSWGHSRIAESNPSLNLPDRPIIVFVRGDPSGTTSIFTQGLAVLDAAQCGGVHAAGIEVSRNWTRRLAYVNDTAKTTEQLLRFVRETPYSVGYSAISPAERASMKIVSLLNLVSGETTVPAQTDVSNALRHAAIHPTRLTVNLATEPSVSGYPFVGVSYLLYRRSVVAGPLNCTSMRSVLDFALSIYKPSGDDIAKDLNFVPMPLATQQYAIDLIYRTSYCGGRLVFDEVPINQSSSFGTTNTVVTVLSCIIFIILAVLLLRVGRQLYKKINSVAPKNDRPVSIVFVDIEDSILLWSEYPTAMSEAIEVYNMIVRDEIVRTECYEVTTIGEAFMIACSSSDKAVELAHDIQLNLWRCEDWPEEFVSERRHSYRSSRGSTRRGSHQGREWNGLRVRIGIATGICTVHHDPDSNKFDYKGYPVNLALRFQQAARGGQTLVTEDCAVNAATTLELLKADVKNLGEYEFDGIDIPLDVIQILPQELKGRQFRGLNFDDHLDGASSRQGRRQSVSPGTARPLSPGEDESEEESDSLSATHRSLVKDPSASYIYSKFLSTLLSAVREEDRAAIVEKLCHSWHITHASAAVNLANSATLRYLARTESFSSGPRDSNNNGAPQSVGPLGEFNPVQELSQKVASVLSTQVSALPARPTSEPGSDRNNRVSATTSPRDPIQQREERMAPQMSPPAGLATPPCNSLHRESIQSVAVSMNGDDDAVFSLHSPSILASLDDGRAAAGPPMQLL